jgi:hypothetical protein
MDEALPEKLTIERMEAIEAVGQCCRAKYVMNPY